MKRVKQNYGEDSLKWTRLHKQAADVTVHKCMLALTPQEGSKERAAPWVDMRVRHDMRVSVPDLGVFQHPDSCPFNGRTLVQKALLSQHAVYEGLMNSNL